jgi:hypothetical protein
MDLKNHSPLTPLPDIGWQAHTVTPCNPTHPLGDDFMLSLRQNAIEDTEGVVEFWASLLDAQKTLDIQLNTVTVEPGDI